MDISTIIPHIEALIFASDKPLTSLELTELSNNAFGFMDDKITLDQVESAIEGILEKYRADFYPFEMRESGGGWQFLTKKDFHKTVAQLNGEKYLKRLSSASLETLAIIAYKQPITKGEIETIRGVNSDYSIQKLLEKELIFITGRNEDLPGKPLVYATSRSFMDYFGINTADDLPKIREVFADLGIEPTNVHNRDEESRAETDGNSTDKEKTSDDTENTLVVRGNGELIEEPAPVVDHNTDPVEPKDFDQATSGDLISEEINEERAGHLPEQVDGLNQSAEIVDDEIVSQENELSTNDPSTDDEKNDNSENDSNKEHSKQA